MKHHSIYLVLVLSAVIHCAVTAAQTDARRLHEADKLHRSYSFSQAVKAYAGMMETADSTGRVELQARIMQSENGLSMLNFATQPTVIASSTVPAADFYLWYKHLKDRRWVPIPNEFTKTGGHPVYNAAYFRPDRDKFIFSAPDSSGAWKLRESKKLSDTLWSDPQPLQGLAASQKDEIFPLLSEDGQRLYFSSDGLAGMGGYDIYVCRLAADGCSWSAPENLGFPYSSPYDDFLYSDTPDGKYTIFASNRDCSADFIKIYVLAFENQPVRKSLDDIEEIRRIAALTPVSEEKPLKPAPARKEEAKDERIAGYISSVRSLMDLRDSLDGCTSDAEMIELQARLASLQDSVGKMEMQMLAEGIIPPSVEAEPEPLPQDSGSTAEKYSFRKNSPGTSCGVAVEPPARKWPEFGLSILSVSEVIEDDELPEGICYRIQLCTVSSKLPESRFKGISPIFEAAQKSGKTVYYAGLFEKYSEASSALAKVKKKGFSSAFIVAWKDGKSCPLSTARADEKKKQ